MTYGDIHSSISINHTSLLLFSLSSSMPLYLPRPRDARESFLLLRMERHTADVSEFSDLIVVVVLLRIAQRQTHL